MKRMSLITIKKVPHTLLFVILTISGAFFLGSCNEDDNGNPAMMTPYDISGDANGSQIVPGASGSGTGTINGTYDPATRMLNYTTTWTGLSGPPLSASFYAGASAINGTATGAPWSLPAESTETGSSSGSMTLSELQASALASGRLYYVYTTALNPNGEIRGQIRTSSQDL